MVPERSKRWPMLGLLAMLAVLSVLCSGCGDGSTPAVTPTPALTPTPSVAPVVGAIAPGFTLATLDGETVKLEELRGKPVLLTFWRTTCGWCGYQMPFVQAAFEEKGEEVSFVAVNVGESDSTVQQYVEDQGLEFTIALDTDTYVTQAYNIRGIPVNFLIDEQGVIKDVRIGAFGSRAELLAALDKL